MCRIYRTTNLWTPFQFCQQQELFPASIFYRSSCKVSKLIFTPCISSIQHVYHPLSYSPNWHHDDWNVFVGLFFICGSREVHLYAECHAFKHAPFVMVCKYENWSLGNLVDDFNLQIICPFHALAGFLLFLLLWIYQKAL